MAFIGWLIVGVLLTPFVISAMILLYVEWQMFWERKIVNKALANVQVKRQTEYENATAEEKAAYESGRIAFSGSSVITPMPDEHWEPMSGPHRKWFIRGWRNANNASRQAYEKAKKR